MSLFYYPGKRAYAEHAVLALTFRRITLLPPYKRTLWGSTHSLSWTFKELTRYRELPVQAQGTKQTTVTWRRGAGGGNLHKVAVQQLACDCLQRTFQEETGSFGDLRLF